MQRSRPRGLRTPGQVEILKIEFAGISAISSFKWISPPQAADELATAILLDRSGEGWYTGEWFVVGECHHPVTPELCERVDAATAEYARSKLIRSQNHDYAGISTISSYTMNLLPPVAGGVQDACLLGAGFVGAARTDAAASNATRRQGEAGDPNANGGVAPLQENVHFTLSCMT